MCDFLRTWQAAPNLCCQNKFDFSIFFAGCSTAVLGNKVALFRTWQAALQLCLGMGLIWSELGRYPHSNAAIISFIRLQFGSLLCSHVNGISLIRLELGRLLCGCAVRISLICGKLGSLLCSGAGIRLLPLCLHSNPIFNGPIRVKTTFLAKTRNMTGTVTSSRASNAENVSICWGHHDSYPGQFVRFACEILVVWNNKKVFLQPRVTT